MCQMAGEAGRGQQCSEHKAPPGHPKLLLALPLPGRHRISGLPKCRSPVPQRCPKAVVLQQLRQLRHHLGEEG